MNTKHTPGPWKALQCQSSLEKNNHWQVLAASPHVAGKAQTVCDINGPWKEENYKANARLIAAAPELLEALKACKAAVENKALLPCSRMELVRDIATPLIAKAQGRE